MKRFLLAVVLLVGAGLVPTLVAADDAAQPSVQATEAAPSGETAVPGGCMPDGSCCGGGACAKAEAGSAGQSAEPPRGCPCAQRRKAEAVE